jgi:TRAP-type C4-dicarboxylate transport system permease small subunit
MPEERRGSWEERVAVASLALLLLITLANVVTRYAIDESFAWTEEISVFLMVVLALAGAAAVGRHDRNIRIEFFLARRTADGEHKRRGLYLFGAVATAFTFFVLAALFVRWVADQVKFSETSMGLGVPLWWYGIFVPPLCLAVAARAGMVAWRLWRTPSSRRTLGSGSGDGEDTRGSP